MIEYKEDTSGITPDQLNSFFVGWPNPPSPETLLQVLNGSSHIVLAIDSETGSVIGFINAVSDNVLSAYIPLLEVLPEYQKRGIGKELTNRMIERLKDFYMVDLICDHELEPFYKKFDLKPSFGMVIRNFDRQNGL